MAINDASVEKLRERFRYNADTGVIERWARGMQEWVPVGALNNNGYLRMRIGKRYYFCHRVAWALHTGEWPLLVIDHINGDRGDNRIVNLRDCTQSVNCKNRHKKTVKKADKTSSTCQSRT